MNNRSGTIYVIGGFSVEYSTNKEIPDNRLDAFKKKLEEEAYLRQGGSHHTMNFRTLDEEDSYVEVIYSIEKLKIPLNPKKFEEEYILSASIWVKDGQKHVHQPKNISSGFVVSGRRHHNCFATIQSLYRNISGEYDTEEIYDIHAEFDVVQGFITSKDRFLDRKEAMELALENGQVKEKSRILISEDLY